MTTKVIAIRFNNETVAQCLLLLQKHGVRIDGMPLSRAVKTVVETIIKQQEKSGELKHLDNATATTFLENHNEPMEDDITNNSFADAMKEVISAPAPEVVSIANTVRQASVPQVSKGVEVDEEDLDQGPVTGNFWNVNYIPLADILEASPDDPLVKKFEEEKKKGKANPDMLALNQRCIEIVYKQIDPKVWGTPAAHKMIANLVQDNM